MRYLMFLWAVVSLAARGQADANRPLGNPLAEEQALVAIMPQLKKLGAPEWVKPGMRLTYHASSALAGAGALPGDEDKVSRYSGAGLVQIDIGAMAEGAVAADSKIWTIDPMGKLPPTISTFAGRTVLPAAGAEYWVHPDALKELAERPIQPLRVVRMKYTLNKKMYDAIRLETGRGAGVEMKSLTYDAATGMLLLSTTAVRMVARRGPTDPNPTAMTHLTRTEFVSARQVNWPWIEDGMPEFAGKTRAMKFGGMQRVTTAVGAVEYPVFGTFTLGKAGKNFLPYHQTFAIRSDPLPQTVEYDRISAAGVLGGLYVSPKVLASLKPQQVIDEDPATGARTATGVFQRGARTISIAEYNPACMAEYTYDTQSGMLVGVMVSQQASGLATKVTLTGVE